MTVTRRLMLVLGLLIIAALLALLLRDIVYEVIILPVAFIGWQLGLWYRSLAQSLWWLLIVVLVLFLLGSSLLPQEKPARRKQTTSKPKRGQVEQLSVEMGRVQGGIYFKWLVANRLGKLAYQILLQRENGRPRSVFSPLVADGWEPSQDLQTYLETGLHGSFSDFPNSKRPFAAPEQTPLDYDVTKAVEFLESQVENGIQSGL